MSWFAIANCKAPGRLGDFRSPGSAVPAEASRREMVGMKGLAPPRLPDSESAPSAIRVKPNARNWCIRQDSHLQTLRSEAEDDNNFTTDAEMVGGLGFAPSSRRLRAGTSLSKFATQANTKAEWSSQVLLVRCPKLNCSLARVAVNRRGEVCDASLTPRFRVAENSVWKTGRISLNTYARRN